MPQDIALFQALGAKMDYLNQRQRVISQNIANTDTPGYRPQDLEDADFSGILKGVTEGRGNVSLETTRGNHMTSGGDVRSPDEDEQKRTYEVAPAGNAVIMEEQLLSSGQTVMDYNLMTNLMQKNMGLIRISIGQQR
ncbi:MAG: flagellar basal body rod protein FlgB [Pseudomonadota bacterium]